jgi:hypothetical protein
MPGPRNSPKAFAEWYEADYFRRPRRPWAWVRVVLAAVAITGAALALTIDWPRAYQAGPLSDPHAFLADNCAACHTSAFVTAGRLLPGHENDRAVPDEACRKCHQAGVHHFAQKRFVGPVGRDGSQSASDCAGCHREHVGGASIARLPDMRCTDCHGNLEAAEDKKPQFESRITSFDGDHPEFGAWRGKPLADPGTLKFNHKVHLELAKNADFALSDRNRWMAGALQRLVDQSCTACHEPDGERRYMRPINYDRHCGECHPLTVPGEPLPRLHHPGPGESAETVRAELLDRFWKQIAGQKPAAPVAPTESERPAVLGRSLPPLSAEEKAKVQKMARDAESHLFDPAGGDVLAILERPQFHMQSGCAYCHEEQTTAATRRDGLPLYKSPNIRDRWKDATSVLQGGMPFPTDRGPPEKRTPNEQAVHDRWFPYSRFSHESHRLLTCVQCHQTPDGKPADESTKTADVLMPNKAICVTCHNRSTTGVRSDCLECHLYHDRAAEPRGLHGRMTVDEAMGLSKPGNK